MFSWLKTKIGNSSRGNRQAHMTFAHTSVGRTIAKTGTILKRQIWIWPIIAIIFLSILGWYVRSTIEGIRRAQVQSELQILLNVETAMLENWYQSQKAIANSLANDFDFRTTVVELTGEYAEQAAVDVRTQVAEEAQHPKSDKIAIHRNLARMLGPALSNHDFQAYFIADAREKILASSRSELIDKNSNDSLQGFVRQAMKGETTVSVPFLFPVEKIGDIERSPNRAPCMFVAAPIRDSDFQVIGVLALQIDPEREFTRIMQLGRLGKTGETYAFARDGLFVSNSRFDHDLILLGLLPDTTESRSILTLAVRDPGGDMTRGFRSSVRRNEMPLTHMAERATRGETGFNIDGYPDYRGVAVVGAWKWLPEFNIGVATEIDLAEAYRSLFVLRTTFWFLFGLLALSAVSIFVFTLMISRLRLQAQKAAIEAQQIGQYTLEQKIGAGGMGVVYRGRHAMLRRDTAIKMLNFDNLSPEMTQRFEREVQITSQLNHPNTIAIFDYGRTPEGVFYYAMEYLDGIDLQQLVERYGPQPVSRVVHILKQCCGSLNEAHAQGLVHRDIKPGNIMINFRGGEPDVVKVLDFGLVVEADARMSNDSNGMTGTPLYMSPESIQSPATVDARSDTYALGAVAYFLLTGQSVFEADSIVELCSKHISEEPLEPSQRAQGAAIPTEMDDVVLACLEKSRSKRPQTMRELMNRLEKVPGADDWDIEEYEAWWTRMRRGTLLKQMNSPSSRSQAALSSPKLNQKSEPTNQKPDSTRTASNQNMATMDFTLHDPESQG